MLICKSGIFLYRVICLVSWPCLCLTAMWLPLSIHLFLYICLCEGLAIVYVYKLLSELTWEGPSHGDRIDEWTYPLLIARGCSSPVGRPSDVKCFRSSLASSKAEEPFWLSLGPSRLSLEPGPNRPNLRHTKCIVDQIQYTKNTELSCIYLNFIYLLFCRLLCKFSMLWRTLLSGQSGCRWGTVWKPTVTKQQGLAGQRCRSHWFIWKLPSSKNQHLSIRIPHETFSFVCEATIENMTSSWKLTNCLYFLQNLNRWISIKTSVTGCFTLWSNYRYKSILCPQISWLLNEPSSLNRNILSCVGMAVIV